MELEVDSCILIGIDKITKGYTCYNSKTKMVIFSKDITIDKSKSMDLSTSTIGRETMETFTHQHSINLSTIISRIIHETSPLVNHVRSDTNTSLRSEDNKESLDYLHDIEPIQEPEHHQ